MGEKSDEWGVPSPFDFPLSVRERNLIIVEGPDCVGKTYVAKQLALLTNGYFYDGCDFGEHWSKCDPMIWFGEMIAVARIGHGIVCDRSALSWFLYNGFNKKYFDQWCEYLTYGNVFVVCMRASIERRIELAARKGEFLDIDKEVRHMKYFDDIYTELPDRVRFLFSNNGDLEFSYWMVFNKIIGTISDRVESNIHKTLSGLGPRFDGGEHE